MRADADRCSQYGKATQVSEASLNRLDQRVSIGGVKVVGAYPRPYVATTASNARLLIVCNKYETGYDDYRLFALYIDKPLVSSMRIVQTLGRLNRPPPQRIHVLLAAKLPFLFSLGFAWPSGQS